MQQFRRLHPGVTVVLHEGDPLQLEEAIVHGEVDIALAHLGRAPGAPQRAHERSSDLALVRPSEVFSARGVADRPRRAPRRVRDDDATAKEYSPPLRLRSYIPNRGLAPLPQREPMEPARRHHELQASAILCVCLRISGIPGGRGAWRAVSVPSEGEYGGGCDAVEAGPVVRIAYRPCTPRRWAGRLGCLARRTLSLSLIPI
ncbi:LysR substrate-binding domain-containing protein [Nonomuraea basaltis]|uniref:LysR substrate-binding domain-containing protein n=1 Tax=Nonomuraea basaltis TaxID=2495887 RepID=UPI003B84B15A